MSDISFTNKFKNYQLQKFLILFLINTLCSLVNRVRDSIIIPHILFWGEQKSYFFFGRSFFFTGHETVKSFFFYQSHQMILYLSTVVKAITAYGVTGAGKTKIFSKTSLLLMPRALLLMS